MHDEAPPNGFCFTQISVKARIKRFGQRALNALITKYEQLPDLEVFAPLDAKTLPWKVKKAALHAIYLIKEKRTGKLKGHTIADGQKHRPLYEKHEISSHVLSQDGFMGSLAIDTHEERYIGIADVTDAFLKADQEDYVVVKFQASAIDALLQINLYKYQLFVVRE